MHTVAVSGVGGVIGYGIVRSLRSSRHQVSIIGLDMYPDAVGRHWCDTFETALATASPSYPDYLLDVANRLGVELFIPGIEQDAFRWACESPAWEQACSARFAVNRKDVVLDSHDKWKFHLRLTGSGFPAIRTAIGGSFSRLASEFGLPLVLKPRISYASKGLRIVEDAVSFDFWRSRMGDLFMVQEYVGREDSEYTVSVFGLGDGRSSGKISFRRKLNREGSTVRAEVISEPGLEDLVDGLVREFKPLGPTNFQFRKHEGVFLPLEINPRISSSTSIRTAFGFNEAEMCVEYYLCGKEPMKPCILRGRAERYLEDFLIPDISQPD